MAEQKQKRIGHIVSHTHWDREWRYPIWQTRFMLIDFMDQLLEVLERGHYKGFLLDGQCSPIPDYLELRPQNRERIEKLVKDGKLAIGPWYTLPDEYPVDGEALVRNLVWGHRISKQYGGVTNLGYTPFGWGQTAQLAQIYAGFGMDVALIGKRVNKERAPQSEFIWESPDGSQLLTTRFGVWGRQNFYFYCHLSALFGVDHFGPGWQYKWENGGTAYHRADTEQMEQDHFRLDPPAKWYPEYLNQEVIDTIWSTTDESVMDNDRLMMNGCDYTAAQPLVTEMIEKLNELDQAEDREWVQTTLPEFVEIMREKIDRSKMKTVFGELRDGPANKNTGNALTTRLYLTQQNKKAQNMLIRFAEPLSVIGKMLGIEYPGKLLQMAWDYLLTAHPHDSINGVTQDKTAQDTYDRLEQVIEMSQAIGNRMMQQLICRMDLSRYEKDDVLLVAFNPLPYPRREIAQAWVNMPAPDRQPTDWAVDPEDYVIFDDEGKAMDTQCTGRESVRYAVAELHTRAFPYLTDRQLMYFDTGTIPAGGYKVFRVGKKEDAPDIQWGGPKDRTGSLLQAPNIMENEYLRVTMNANGTFDLFDKQRGVTYAGLNYFEDRGEHGDYWINNRPMYDQVHTSQGCAARIWSEQDGPLQATLVSEITMRIPKRGNKEQQRRGDELEDLPIRTTVTLKAGQPQVDVHVEFENNCEDHYLRAMFPTGLKDTDFVDAGGHFMVDHRSIRPQGPTKQTCWPDMATQPQNNFVDLSDNTQGIAFLNSDLTEYEVTNTPERVVALSLLRSVRNWVCTETRVGSSWPSQKGGQCLGKHKAHYAIRPHGGTWNDADIPLEAERFNVPLRLIQTRTNQGHLPDKRTSFLQIENNKLRFATLKKAEDRDTVILRLYNPTGDIQKSRITFPADLTGAWHTNLNEQRANEIKLDGKNAVHITADPYKIVTVEVQPK